MNDIKKIIILILLIFLLINNNHNEKFINKFGKLKDPKHSDYKIEILDDNLTDSKNIIIINQTSKLLKKKRTSISDIGDMAGDAVGAAGNVAKDPTKAVSSAGSMAKGAASGGGLFIKLPVNRRKDIDRKFVMRVAPFDLKGNARPLGSDTGVCIVSSQQIMPKQPGNENSRDKAVRENLSSKKFYRILIINLDDTNPKSLLNSLFGDYSYHQKKLYQFGVSLVPYEQVCKIYINYFYFDKNYFSQVYLPKYKERVRNKQREIYKKPIDLKDGETFIDKINKLKSDSNYVFVNPPLEILAIPCVSYFFTKVKKPMLLGYHNYTPEEYDEDNDNMSYNKIMDMYYNYYEAEISIENSRASIETTFGELYEIIYKYKDKKRPNFTQDDINMMMEGPEKEAKKVHLGDYNNFKNTYAGFKLDINRDEADKDKDNLTPTQKIIMDKEFSIISNKENIIEQEEIKKANIVNMNTSNINKFILGLFFVKYKNKYSVYED